MTKPVRYNLVIYTEGYARKVIKGLTMYQAKFMKQEYATQGYPNSFLEVA